MSRQDAGDDNLQQVLYENLDCFVTFVPRNDVPRNDAGGVEDWRTLKPRVRLCRF
jgi:hypothetical protein